jgi:uncharacterized membrane protein
MTLIDALLTILLILGIVYLIVAVLRAATPGAIFAWDRVILLIVMLVIVLWLSRGHLGLR